MATASSPIPRIVKIHVGTLSIERKQLPFLHARCVETHLSFHKFLAELLDARQPEFHKFLADLLAQERHDCDLVGWKPSAPGPPPKGAAEEEAGTEIDGPPRRDSHLTDDDRDRIVVAMLNGETKIGAVALRFGRGESTIRRAWKARRPSPELIQRIIFLHGKSGDEHMGIQAIAQAVGISEVIVTAIVANHRPLVKEAGSVYAHPPRRPGGWDRQRTHA